MCIHAYLKPIFAQIVHTFSHTHTHAHTIQLCMHTFPSMYRAKFANL